MHLMNTHESTNLSMYTYMTILNSEVFRLLLHKISDIFVCIHF